MTELSCEKLKICASDLVKQSIQYGFKIATAESCTGGWVAKLITDVAGSSACFDCSLVTYSNQAKQELLGVPVQTLKDFGAVSQETVKAMVLGLLDRCSADMGVAISGIAGPGGGSAEKPVGTVWLAWARPGQVIECVRYQFEGDRDAVRRQAAYQALKGIERLMSHGR